MTETLEKVACYHCGQPCQEDALKADDKTFCCYGCKVVFEIINENNMCQYYELEAHPGVNARNANHEEFDYLNEPAVRAKLLEFDSAEFARVRFFVPAVHCSSCIWLLENLQKVDRGILKLEVNFSKKEVLVDFNPRNIALGRIASILSSLGYAPRISLEDQVKEKPKRNSSLVLKLGVAGFAFGNVMLFSFPEYLGLDPHDEYLGRVFSWLNILLSVPVLLFSASEYFTSAVKSFKQRQINIDVPIALGLLALFFRSSYDIVTGFGPGYLDSFTGLVFFLLIGRWFQSRTYESLAFDRDFKSYFPLAVQKIVNGSKQPTIIFSLQKGDTIQVRNLEIIPADSILLDKVAFIDYSFVTGESRPVKVNVGDLVYAGGRLIGQPVNLVVHKATSQSKLTSLWNAEAFRKRYESGYKKIIDRSARIFTWIVMAIAVVTAIYWQMTQPAQMWLVLTSVLMVACPCALALAAPFTYGSMLRVFGRNNFYLKNADVIERLATIDSVVFDKTGTVTHGQAPGVSLTGELTTEELVAVKLLTSYSTHPLSNLVSKSIHLAATGTVVDFKEIPGKGIEGSVHGKLFKIGSATFTGFGQKLNGQASYVFVAIDDEVKGYFTIQSSIRENMRAMLQRLGHRCAALLSGDNSNDTQTMTQLFPEGTQLKFEQRPNDKMEFIADLQGQGKKVMMLGDGLNDAGALKQADVGIAVTDDTGLFTPGCDGILQGHQLQHLDQFISLAKSSSRILKIAFGISFFYNIIALTFAVTGHLTPLVAAILMPISSVSVVGFSSLSVNFTAKQKFKTK